MRINSKNVHFILVEPHTPGNIGAAARALKTMGFNNLVLVNPGDFNTPEARWMAHASEEILQKATIFDTLQDAVGDKHFVAAATQRERGFHLPYFTPAGLAEKIIPISMDHQVAIVFGREKSGLTNEELGSCDAITTIPAQTSHPSLNLSQAVMIYCYELFQTAYGDLKEYKYKLASRQELESLYRHMRESLEKVNFVPIDSWENFTMRFSRLLGRAQTEVRDVRVWHKIFKSFDEYITQLEKRLQKEQKKTD
ncbi:MAG: RNA methyltransferase [Calditrichaeota bacterium]|nr:RNA methyltransferase [Calditrichota bacterium]RQW02367.1 MAG: RNA methyltransferase [Calditrichota bacterium]